MKLLPAFLGHKAATSIIVAVLAVGAAVGAFASQDVLPGTTDDTVTTQTDDGVTDDGTVIEDETTDDTEGEVDGTETDGTTDGTTDETDGDTEETEGDTETDGTTDETDGDTDTEDDADTEVEDDEEDVPREIVGIPDENPNFEPENGDGTCDKGETVVKTTPSGKQVNVPCHSVEPRPPGFSKGQKGGDAPTEDSDDAEDEEEEGVE